MSNAIAAVRKIESTRRPAVPLGRVARRERIAPPLAVAVVVAVASLPRPARAQTAGDTRASAPRVSVRGISRPRPPSVLTSADVRPGGTLALRQVFDGLGCAGGNLSPALVWRGAPAGTRSYAVTVYDPDAPTGSGFWHWVLYNIPTFATSLPEGAGTTFGDRFGALPTGAVQAPTDYGVRAYTGPCPPSGDGAHRYVVTVYALAVEHLDLPLETTPAVVDLHLHAHALGTASLTARYARPDPAPHGASRRR